MKIYEGTVTYTQVQSGKGITLDSPEKLRDYMEGAFDPYPVQESFWVICLNRKNRALGRFMISLGTVSGALVHPREVFRPAILAHASAIIICHNHPSGDCSPSSADIQVTRSMKRAADLLDINLLDHVIIGEREEDPANVGYYSFTSNGMI